MMPKSRLYLVVFLVVTTQICPFLMASAYGGDQPNILWLTSEDHGPKMGCYGDKLARTPHVDALAAKGMRYRMAWSNAPVCAPARTTLITGAYPPSFGGEHMRSEVRIPQSWVLFPIRMRSQGFYRCNNAKEDYNISGPFPQGYLWDESSPKAHWRNRPPGQPFFAVFNSNASHESQIRKRPHNLVTDPAKVRVPEYHPDTPEVRQDWAQYYDQVSAADADAGKRLKELERDGLADDTIVFYFADHGPGMPRSKRWPSNSGLQVPFVVYFPPKWRKLAPRDYQPGGVSDRLISFVDLAPTMLSLTGIYPPSSLQGTAFAGSYQQDPQSYLFGFRGRMDERIDLVRSVTDGRYVYLRNYMPHLSQGQHVAYQFETPTTQVWRKLFDQGKLNEAQSLFWKAPKPPEELYDLTTDPDEVRNLAKDPGSQDILKRFRKALNEQTVRIHDCGFLTEEEVHKRSLGRSIREALAKKENYDFEAIFQAADAASFPQTDVKTLSGFLKSRDSGVRFWGAMGALIQGPKTVEALHGELIECLMDDSTSVRIAVGEALAQYGTEADRPKAMKALVGGAHPVRMGGYASIAAMNALDRLGEKAESAKEFVKTMPVKDPNAPERVNGYVARLRQTILEKGK